MKTFSPRFLMYGALALGLTFMGTVPGLGSRTPQQIAYTAEQYQDEMRQINSLVCDSLFMELIHSLFEQVQSTSERAYQVGLLTEAALNYLLGECPRSCWSATETIIFLIEYNSSADTTPESILEAAWNQCAAAYNSCLEELGL